VTPPVVQYNRRDAWRLAKAMAPDLAAKVVTPFGFRIQAQGWDGIVYRSVRARPRGTCVVVFRRTVLVACVEMGQWLLTWDGVAFSVG
jgi:hypothetical protein